MYDIAFEMDPFEPSEFQYAVALLLDGRPAPVGMTLGQAVDELGRMREIAVHDGYRLEVDRLDRIGFADIYVFVRARRAPGAGRL